MHALLLGAPGIAARAEELGRYGADVVFVVEHAGLARYNPEVFAATAAERLRAGDYRAAFFPASAQGRDLAPRTAAALGVSLASDVTDFELQGDAVLARHPGYTGKVIRHAAADGLAGAGVAAPRRHHRGGAAAHARGWSRRSRPSIPPRRACR